MWAAAHQTWNLAWVGRTWRLLCADSSGLLLPFHAHTPALSQAEFLDKDHGVCSLRGSTVDKASDRLTFHVGASHRICQWCFSSSSLFLRSIKKTINKYMHYEIKIFKFCLSPSSITTTTAQQEQWKRVGEAPSNKKNGNWAWTAAKWFNHLWGPGLLI